MKKNLLFLILLSLLISGCNIGGQQEEVKPLFIGEKNDLNQNTADEAKQIVLSMKEVIEVKGVNVKENIYIATKVTHFNRLFLDRIRKDAHDKLKKRFPDAKIHVSTDKKVFLELEELEKKLYKNKVEEEKLEKEINRIEKFMKG